MIDAVLAFSGLLLAVPVGYRWTDPARGRWRTTQWGLASLAVLSVPWWLPANAAILRFFVAVCSVLAFMRLTETLLRQQPRSARGTFWRYFWYFVFVGDIRLTNDQQERHAARRAGLRRLARAVAKGLGLLVLFAVSTARPQLWEAFLEKSLWCVWAGYLAATGGADFVCGTQMWLSGHGAAETFRSPPLARSPRDFWGRRWNLVFRNLSHRLLFQRAARGHGPLAAGAVVFLWSIIAHEYLIFSALGHSQGHMSAFFALHGAVTLASSRLKVGRSWPTVLAIGAHWLWMLATAPLFFAPILEVFPAREWSLW